MPRQRARMVVNELPELIDTVELAAYLKTTPAAVRIMLSRGELPRPIMRARRHLWRVSDIVNWLGAKT